MCFGVACGTLIFPQVPPADAVRLTQGSAAESRYLLGSKNGKKMSKEGPTVEGTAERNDGNPADRDEEDAQAAPSGKQKEKTPPLLAFFESDQSFASLCRLAYERFVNGDRLFFPRPKAEPNASPKENYAYSERAAVDNPAGGRVPGEEEARASPGWDGPLPDEQALLVADGFLVPGKSDGGVYVVVPGGADKSGEGAGEGDGLRGQGDRGDGGGGDKIVRLTGIKRSVRGWLQTRGG